MKSELVQLTVAIELRPGEKLSLPQEFVEGIGPGRWLITLQPAVNGGSIRDHRALLSSYVPEDEGLYDDVTRR
jgi:hypothetical protein